MDKIRLRHGKSRNMKPFQHRLKREWAESSGYGRIADARSDCTKRIRTSRRADRHDQKERERVCKELGTAENRGKWTPVVIWRLSLSLLRLLLCRKRHFFMDFRV
uniref:Uncharacterized protein n=1 Tax=Heterorhabditis bacteriophora TaxID=37862 RepID=A0A1I7WCM8_HETBA